MKFRTKTVNEYDNTGTMVGETEAICLEGSRGDLRFKLVVAGAQWAQVVDAVKPIFRKLEDGDQISMIPEKE